MNMKVYLPEISQAAFEDAFRVLEECKQPHAKEFGFNYPYFSPGGQYGQQWWAMDFSYALMGYKWYDQAFCEQGLLNLVESQCDNGRIRLWGHDRLLDIEWHPIQKTNASCYPEVMECFYSVIERSGDQELRKKVYDMMKNYLAWWFSDRYDPKTGLITALFEETLRHYLGCEKEFAALDANVYIATGCYYTALLARQLGFPKEEAYYLQWKDKISEAINKYLWNEEKGAYYSYNLKENKMEDCLSCTTFYPLCLDIAPADRKEKLLKLLLDTEHFNWDIHPVTTVSRQDPLFFLHEGDYYYNKSWEGSVWSSSNRSVIRALNSCGEKALSAELTWKTICLFNNNYAEFVDPFDGSKRGVERYAWTASHYIELIIEEIFGLHYEAADNTLTIRPNLPEALKKETISLQHVPLPSGGTVDVTIRSGIVEYQLTDTSASVCLK